MDFLFIHSAVVERIAKAEIDDETGRIVKGRNLITNKLKCRIEGLSAREKDILSGRFHTARYRITWPANGNPVLTGGEILSFGGKRYKIEDIVDDTMRELSPIPPYYTGLLVETQHSIEAL